MSSHGKNEELHKLRQENRQLKKRLAELERQPHDEKNGESEQFDAYQAKNYFSFLLLKARENSFFGTAEKLFRYFRNSLWVTRILKYGLIIYNYLQAGAFVLLYSAIFILFIPITLALMLLTLIAALFLRKRNADKILAVAKKRVLFIIPKSKEEFDNADAGQEVLFAQDATVFIVSPYFFSRTDIGGVKKRPPYVCARDEGENTYLIRKYFYFYLRRRLEEDGFEITQTMMGDQTC